MKYLLTTTLLLIAFTATSQVASKDSLVCFTIEQAAKIAQRLDALTICLDDVANKETLIKAYAEQAAILKPKIVEQQTEIERLTKELNDNEAKVKRLKSKRLWWGIGGVAVGALTYSFIKK